MGIYVCQQANQLKSLLRLGSLTKAGIIEIVVPNPGLPAKRQVPVPTVADRDVFEAVEGIGAAGWILQV